MFNFVPPDEWVLEPETAEEIDRMGRRAKEICAEDNDPTIEQVEELKQIAIRLSQLSNGHPEAHLLNILAMQMIGAAELWKAELVARDQPKGFTL